MERKNSLTLASIGLTRACPIWCVLRRNVIFQVAIKLRKKVKSGKMVEIRIFFEGKAKNELNPTMVNHELSSVLFDFIKFSRFV